MYSLLHFLYVQSGSSFLLLVGIFSNFLGPGIARGEEVVDFFDLDEHFLYNA